ncbi:MAG: sugar transferase [Fermentimonas sp.]|jgi:lipopolysaccharide/colanic/teichoic acid biosynthesis glycosyltransferase
MYKHFFKRLLDFLLALIGLILISPLFLVLWVWLTIANKGAGAFFAQERPGKNEKIFRLYKFKSMTDERDADGNLLPDGERLTKVGKFIRKTSLDELPQLWNVLKGDMSLIGPRPLFVRYLPYYTNRERLRHTVRPGITGLSQVKGRNFLPWDQRLELDVKYTEQISFILDIKILLKTIYQVFKRKNIVIIASESGKPLDIERKKNVNI